MENYKVSKAQSSINNSGGSRFPPLPKLSTGVVVCPGTGLRLGDKCMKSNVLSQAGASEKDLMVLSRLKLYKSKKW